MEVWQLMFWGAMVVLLVGFAYAVWRDIKDEKEGEKDG